MFAPPAGTLKISGVPWRGLWLIVALRLAGELCGSDWPQWRGPDRAANWTESGIVASLPAAGLKILWRAPVGMGFSSPVISDGMVYCSDAVVTKPVVRERIHCMDSGSGKLRWTYAAEHSSPDWFFTEEQARGPGSTPIVWKGKLYSLDLWGTVVCLETTHGNVVWKKNLSAEFTLKGTSLDSSPLIEGDCLILMVGGKPGAGVVALDRNTGRELWRALDESVTWSSPIVVAAGGARQLIVWTQQSVTALNPTNGNVYWREATSTGGSPGTAGVATPVFRDPYLLVGGWMFQLSKDHPGARTLWPAEKGVARRILSDTSTGMLLGDYVYSGKTGGEFVCLKIATGEEIWKTGAVTTMGNGASVHGTLHGDFGYLLTDLGELIQVKLTPDGYSEVSRTKLIEPTWPWAGRKVAWAAPSFAHDNIYSRNDRELICASLALRSYPAAKSGD